MDREERHFPRQLEATEHGARVAMVEKGIVGGTCVNIGCVPSKTLLRAGEINRHAASNPFQGLKTTIGPIGLESLVSQKNELVKKLRDQKYESLIDEYRFELIRGEALFISDKEVEVNGRTITARFFNCDWSFTLNPGYSG